MKRSKKSDSDAEEAKSNKRPREEQTTPQYGSKEYWEARYKSHLPGVEVSSKKSKDTANNDEENPSDGKIGDEEYVLDGIDLSKDAINPGHAWYFTYQELRPLILPLIINDGESEAEEEDLELESDCEDGDSWEEEEVDDEEADEEEEEESDEGSIKDKKDVDKEDVDDKHINRNEMPITEQITPPDKPKKVLEIGCGDVPIGAELAADLVKMQQDTGVSTDLIVNEISCIDYSEIVVKTLIDKQKKEQNVSASKLQVQFDALDARTLPYTPNKYDLVLEKGTLDAMLSDPKEGRTNCVKIVKEMARVTNIGGSILIVSHLNANEQKGLDWLEDVVFSGLEAEFNERREAIIKEAQYYTWSVEVHGGEGQIVNDEDDEEFVSYGPAVYIIRKKSVSSDVAGKLFSRKRKDIEKTSSSENGDDDENDMTLPPVKVEFLTYD